MADGAGPGQSEDDRSSERRIAAGYERRHQDLQALLNFFLTAGDVGEDGTPIPPCVDGTAGAKTKQAALAFQTAAHLATDAVVGPLTWKKLIEQDF